MLEKNPDDRLFRWHCPQCDTTIVLITGESRDDETRGFDATGWMSFEPRCPNCQTLMVDEDLIAAWFIRAHNVQQKIGFTLTPADFAEWRAEQVKAAHDENCEVYDRKEKPCGCGADAQRTSAGKCEARTWTAKDPSPADRVIPFWRLVSAAETLAWAAARTIERVNEYDGDGVTIVSFTDGSMLSVHSECEGRGMSGDVPLGGKLQAPSWRILAPGSPVPGVTVVRKELS